MPTVPVLDGFHEVEDLGSLDPAWAGIRTTHHEVAGTRVRVLDAGPHDTAEPPIVLVHGLGGAATNWIEVQARLAVGRRVLALDLPGHGETVPPRPESPRPAAAARFVGHVLRTLDLGPVVLVGNSMGGLVSTLVAAEQPELVRGLVLVGPALPQAHGRPQVSAGVVRSFAPFVVPPLGRAIRRRRARRLTAEERYQLLVDMIAADPDALPERVIALGQANIRRGDELPWRLDAFSEATAGIGELLLLGGRDRTLAAIDAITVPTLLLWGTEDRLVHENVVATIRHRRPDWEVVVLDGVGHVPQLEVPARFVELVEAHVARVVAAA